MKRWLILFLCVVCLFGQDNATFRVDVQLVRLLATVKDNSGKPIGGLGKEDFTIFDNGVKQQISVFERQTGQPLSVGILVDISGSTAKELKYETESVSRFLAALFKEGSPEDRASLFLFNWQVTQAVDYTRRHEQIARALRAVKAEAGTSMYDAIYLASGDIRERDGRHVLILISDGGDTFSSKGFHEALEAAHKADAVLYAVLVMPITNDPGRNIGGENALTTMTQTTGGKMFVPNLSDLDGVFDEILRDLRTQYLIGYYPKSVRLTKDRFHKLKVEVGRKDLRVLTRTGYYGEFDSSAK